MLINLKPPEHRKGSAVEIMRRIQQETVDITGIRLFLQPVQDLTIESRFRKNQYQFSLEDPNSDELDDWTSKMIDILAQRPELTDVSSDAQNNGLEAHVVIDRPTASRLGISAGTVDANLYDAYGQRIVSTIFSQLSQYRVILEVNPEFSENPANLNDLYLQGAKGTPVPMSAVVQVAETTTALSIERQGQFPASMISFNLAPGTSLLKAIGVINDEVKKSGLPPSVTPSFQGTADALQSSLGNELFLILSALLAVYIVLGVLYESYIHPLTILSTLPSAGVGALASLLLFRTEFTIITLIGIILLIGIVKKNGIMMVDFALQGERNEGMSPEKAIFQAAKLRFRPIMMTTLAALFAAVPLAFGGGMGFELRRPLGIAIIGGLIFSQALTLYTTPVVYLWFDRIGKKRGASQRGKTEAA